MRTLRACIHIKASVHTVSQLADPAHRHKWMGPRHLTLLRTVTEAWEATPEDGGTRFMLCREYTAPLPFLEPFVGGDLSHDVASSLSRLKQMAETEQPPGV